MILASSVFTDVAIDDVAKDENGSLSYPMFNRLSWRGQLRMQGWLTGNLDDVNPPEKVSTQKARDWMAPFIKKYSQQVKNGEIIRPSDYYLFRDLYRLKGVPVVCTDGYEEEEIEVKKTPIELLDNSKFTTRCNTYIGRLKPAVKNIAKLTGTGFEFQPADIGSVVLEYYRYPVKAEIVTMDDVIFNDKVPDEAATTNFEWGEECRNLLVWFIVQQFSIHIREQGLQQQNQLAGK